MSKQFLLALPVAAEYEDAQNFTGGTACEASQAAMQQKQAQCTEAATCDALSGKNPAGNRAFTACVAGQ